MRPDVWMAMDAAPVAMWSGGGPHDDKSSWALRPRDSRNAEEATAVTPVQQALARLQRPVTSRNLRLISERSVNENPWMKRTLDPGGAHIAALRRLADFGGLRVLEMGCGEGRLTAGIAAEAGHVLSFDPDAESISEAQRSLPAELAERVVFRAASAQEIEIERGAFDLVVFSWSL